MNSLIYQVNHASKQITGLELDKTQLIKLLELIPDSEIKLDYIPLNADNIGLLCQFMDDLEKEIAPNEEIEGIVE